MNESIKIENMLREKRLKILQLKNQGMTFDEMLYDMEDYGYYYDTEEGDYLDKHSIEKIPRRSSYDEIRSNDDSDSESDDDKPKKNGYSRLIYINLVTFIFIGFVISELLS
jgi:hypothetical protein